MQSLIKTISKFQRSMSTIPKISPSNIPLDVTNNDIKTKVFNPKSNAAKRKRPSHRKPPKSNHDPTSPLGVLSSFEIPNLLKLNTEKINKLVNQEDVKEAWVLDDIVNPVRDIINDRGVLDAYNWREIENVEVLSMSSKGDGLAIIKAPSYEAILECQELANEREWKEINEKKELLEKEQQDQNQDQERKTEESKELNSKKRPQRRDREEPYRRTIDRESIPKIQIATIPFTYPGDIVNIKIYHTNQHFVDAEITKYVKLSDLRTSQEDPYKAPCAYFGICSGCQYQNLEYENQLKIKKEVVENAFKHFCSDGVNWEGKVLDTVESPLKFGYRTKLTPHYDMPRSGTRGLNVPRLGFGWKGKGASLDMGADDTSEVYDNSKLELVHSDEVKPGMRKRAIRPYFGDVLDIEDCIIGTDIVRMGLVDERLKLAKEWNEGVRSKKGVTVLLRENNIIHDGDADADSKADGKVKADADANADANGEVEIFGSSRDGKVTCLPEDDFEGAKVVKTCVTENQRIVSEIIDTGLGRKLRFDFIANEFFQNNNSILPKVIKYVFENLGKEMEYLVDAYCGSGLFSVSIASIKELNVKKVLGVEISERAVEFAKKNAALNKIDSEHCDFIQGKAEKLFEHINFPKDKTGVILDPPRKGCDEIFLNQLSEFEPNRIVYVSCNVHSQARDIKFFLNETANGSKYEVESIRGFDFFPQTHHVESVAVLYKK